MNRYSTVTDFAKFRGLSTSVPRAVAVARIEGWAKARRGAPASPRTGTSPVCSNSSPRLLRRAQKPASQCHCTAPARDGQRKLPLTVLTDCFNNVRVMRQDLFVPCSGWCGRKSRRRACVRQRPPASARALPVLGFWRTATARVAVHKGPQRERERNAHAHRAGRTAERLSRSVRHGALSRQDRLRHHVKTQARVPSVARQRNGIFFAALLRVFFAGD